VEGELPGATRVQSGLAIPAHDTLLSAVVSVDSTTGWIVIDARAANHEDTVEFLDSVRFYRNGVPTLPSDALPPDSMSAVDVHITGHLHANDSSEFVGHAEHSSHINLEVLDRDPGLGTVTYQLNLTASDEIDGTAWDSTWGVCDVDVAAQRTVTNMIEVDEDSTAHHPVHDTRSRLWQALGAHEGCPLSGTVALHMDVYIACTGGDAEVTVDTDWSVSAVFTGGDQVRVTFTSEGLYWSKDVDCSELSEL
jgi:hypothetical protein